MHQSWSKITQNQSSFWYNHRQGVNFGAFCIYPKKQSRTEARKGRASLPCAGRSATAPSPSAFFWSIRPCASSDDWRWLWLWLRCVEVTACCDFYLSDWVQTLWPKKQKAPSILKKIKQSTFIKTSWSYGKRFKFCGDLTRTSKGKSILSGQPLLRNLLKASLGHFKGASKEGENHLLHREVFSPLEKCPWKGWSSLFRMEKDTRNVSFQHEPPTHLAKKRWTWNIAIAWGNLQQFCTVFVGIN